MHSEIISNMIRGSLNRAYCSPEQDNVTLSRSAPWFVEVHVLDRAWSVKLHLGGHVSKGSASPSGVLDM